MFKFKGRVYDLELSGWMTIGRFTLDGTDGDDDYLLDAGEEK